MKSEFPSKGRQQRSDPSLISCRAQCWRSSPRRCAVRERAIFLSEPFSASQKDFYQLKELERIAPKSKGIVQQAVKEVLQDLVGDSLVQSDKIGTSICESLEGATRGAQLIPRRLLVVPFHCWSDCELSFTAVLASSPPSSTPCSFPLETIAPRQGARRARCDGEEDRRGRAESAKGAERARGDGELVALSTLEDVTR